MLLVSLLLCVDRIGGKIFNLWLSNITTGAIGKENYIADCCKDSILVFGSSRAENHYNAKIIEDKLNISTFNCGTCGYGVVLAYGRLSMILEKYNPKLVIMEITPESDLIKNDDNQKDLGRLKRFYDKDVVRSIFYKIDSKVKFKMFSHLYRFNSDIMHNPFRLLKRGSIRKESLGDGYGYLALNDNFDPMKVRKKIDPNNEQIDSLKLFYLKMFALKAMESSKLIFVVSPYWDGADSIRFKPAKDLADSLGIPFLNYSNNEKYVHNNSLFYDAIHLNNLGASEFSKDIACDLFNGGLLE